MANKIKFGIKNVYYAKATIADDGTATYVTPVAWPGAVSIALDPEGETNKFFADNIAYAVTNSNAGYSGDLEMALVSDSFRKDILGEIESGKVLIEDANAAVTHFALLFQFEGDESATLHCLYNCTASRPGIEGDTKEDSTEAKTETVTITAASVYNSNIQKDIVKAKLSDKTDSHYSTWFTTVFQPAASGT